jgi:cation diffusion facilitator CzcD-associated flavoprotein CzcO
MPPPRILILGAGFSGLGAAIRLKRAGFTGFTLVDRGDDVGGVWRDKTYPGCACDVASHLYSFSFDPDFDWLRTHAGQPQILDYLRQLVARHGLAPHLRLRTEVRKAVWDEGDQLWRLHLAGGEVLEAEVFVSAVGGLVQPSMPVLEGLADFPGPVFHSSRWRHDVDLAGKRVALIGTGASAIQVGPALADTVGQLHVFQRNAPWVFPRRDRPYGRVRRWLYRCVPGLRRLNRWRLYALHEALALSFLGHAWAEALLRRVTLRHLRRQLPDAALRDSATPRDRPGCRRVLVSDDWYPMLAKPHVSLVTQGIERVTPEGVQTRDGERHAVDAIVLCTGFTVSGALGRTQGRGGRVLGALWSRAAQTYLGLVAHGFPNMFTLLGPGTGTGSNSALFMLESQLDYLVQAVRYLAQGPGAVIDIKAEVQAASDAEVQRRLQGTVWASGCKSWYRAASGRIETLWPDFSFNYRRRTRRFDASLYDVGWRVPPPPSVPRPLPADAP